MQVLQELVQRHKSMRCDDFYWFVYQPLLHELL